VRAAAILVVLVALAGCGGDDGPIHVTNLPHECAGDFGGLVKALGAAPGRVLVSGEPISACFTLSEDATDLQELGTSLLTAAQLLGDRAASDPDAALQLGYLIGAARRGSQHNGVAAELVRRLEGETGRLGANTSAYRRGLRAGLTQG
jgi:hypothetical protein